MRRQNTPTPEAIADTNRLMAQHRVTVLALGERPLDHLARRADYYIRQLHKTLDGDHDAWALGQCRMALSFVRVPLSQDRTMDKMSIALSELLALLDILGLELVAQDCWDEILERPEVRFWLRAVREG